MGWFARVTGWFEHHRFTVDALGAALFALFVAATSADVFRYVTAGRGGAMLWAVALAAPLAWRRVRPVASAVAVYAVALAHLLAGYPLLLPADLAVLVALYSVTVHGPRWAHLTAIGSTGAGCLLFTVVSSVGPYGAGSLDTVVDLLPSAVLMGSIALAVWAFGLTRRYRRVTVDALRDRAERLEVERDQQARIATAAERARIAREMHDIVAHSLSIVVAQADGGRYAAAADPDAAVRSLGVISETGRAALADMRRLLGVLRDDDSPDGAPGADGAATTGGVTTGAAATAPAPRVPPSSPAPLAPQPDDAELDALVAQARAAGTRVSLVRVGTSRRLPPGAGVTLHRVTQEALTNVRKHAGPDPRVTVVLRWEPESVTVEVADDGRGAATEDTAAGYGLLGMRERAAMFDGTLTAGPRPGGGWRVRFTMPVPAAAPPAGRTGGPAQPQETA
ncbi:sensor histidine kinase [Isoptericola aurantiacus]|uniref:sensor histidine kinase n=1 Tax=Isoptericola aurantiacus TaxID=3377839 RepID=UPI00383BC5B3